MREFIDGATAIARGAIDAGVSFFAGYPISPATPILLHMIRELPKVGGVAIQGEDEIASISMCVAAAMTGARAFTATSGPGMSLYSETIGMSIMGEVPLVIVDVQRMGPATGGATTPAQGDIQFARWGNSGGYPIIALAPGSIYECYSLTRRAFDLAERFRCPVFLLTDKELFQALNTVDVDRYKAPLVRERVMADALPAGAPGLRPEETYVPYRIAAPDAIPDYAPIGGPHIVRFTGSTHDEHGFLTKDPVKVGRLNEHLRHKIEDHANELDLALAAPVSGASTAFISYGIVTAAMQEASQMAAKKGRAVSTLAVQTLWPVPEKSILEIVQPSASEPPVGRVVVAEMNNGDFRREVERVVWRWAATTRVVPPEIVGINRVDGELITPAQFLSQIL
jgi:2-oxoglutarate/2-oxoacid ferredoxin oxidoreductase subunit alpha